MFLVFPPLLSLVFSRDDFFFLFKALRCAGLSVYFLVVSSSPTDVAEGNVGRGFYNLWEASALRPVSLDWTCQVLPSFFFPLSRWMAGGAGVEYFPAPSRSGDCQSAPPETGLNRNRALWSVSVQFSIVAQLCPTLCDPMNRSTPDLPVHHQPGVHPNPCPSSQWWHPTIILCRPLLLLPSIFHSIRVFSNESALLIRWPKYWSLSLNISASNEHPGLISFTMDWLDLLAVQGTLKSLSSPTTQFKRITSSVLSLFYCPALTSLHDYWRNHSFGYTDLFGKVMSLLFNTLSRFTHL